jgi:hypothetical protein
MTQQSPDIDIASMLDSIEEAITWSSVPPPPEAGRVSARPGADVETVLIEVEAAANEPSGLAAPEVEPSPLPRAEDAFTGISCELRSYPDAPPRPAGVGPRVRGSAQTVMQGFRWGGA